MKKQMEGDEDQRRASAADARDEDSSPSEEGATTGASKQRRTLGNDADHEERLRGGGRGKQQPNQFAPEPKPGSTPSVRADLSEKVSDAFPSRNGDEYARTGDLGEDDQRVLRTLAELEDEESAPTLAEIAREGDLDTADVMPALQRLINDHDMVQEVGAGSAEGPRYRVKARS